MRAEPPDEVRRLAGERQRARDGRDYAAADALRDRIREAGFEVVDTPEGPVLERRAFDGPDEPGPTGPRVVRPSEVVRLLDQPPTFDASVQWLVQGWPDDVIRGIDSFRRHHPGAAIQHVVVDAADVDPGMWPEDVDLVRLPAGTGWATARNAGLVRAAGPVVLVVDGSVEADGDVLGPLAATLEDPAVGVAGPFGIVTEDLREFHGSEGPDVDAVEGYLMAVRRELILRGLRFDEKFRFYRTCDIELSFQVKAMGLRATVSKVPVRRHEHRMWTNTPEDRRRSLSKRNYYRFLDRWRGRTDLLVAGSSEPRG